VYRDEDDSSDDVELTEFSDEIDAWILEEFVKIGLETARSVLNRNEDFLVNRTDLELETIREVLKILKDELS
jgi:N utilization substance protein A